MQATLICTNGLEGCTRGHHCSLLNVTASYSALVGGYCCLSQGFPLIQKQVFPNTCEPVLEPLITSELGVCTLFLLICCLDFVDPFAYVHVCS